MKTIIQDVGFERYSIVKIAETAATVTKKIEDLTGGNMVVVPFQETANKHHMLVPAQRFPAEEEKASAYNGEDRKIYRKVTNIEFDYEFACLWCVSDATFRIENGKIVAAIPPGRHHGYDITVADITQEISTSTGVVMDGAICSKNEWVVLSDVCWEELDGVSEMILAARG